MPASESHALANVDVRATLLWRESRWHCECGLVNGRWIAHLYLEEAIVAECAFTLLSPMLRMTYRWQAAVQKNPSALILVDDAPFEDDRRQNEPERRVVPRGGRRGSDPGRPPSLIEERD
jgi:hypothetical protein